jgi:uncharacterized protein (DUF1330 family)
MSAEFGYIVVLARIAEREQFGHYVKALPPIYQKFGGQYLCLAPHAREVLPSNEQPSLPQALVISRFSSVTQAKAFWWSSEYQNAAKLRAGTGEFLVACLNGTLPNKKFGHVAVLIDVDQQQAPGLVFAAGDALALEGEKMGRHIALVATEGCNWMLMQGRALCAPRID